MAKLELLTIIPEKDGSAFQFDGSKAIPAQFNPSKLTFIKSANWQSAKAAQRDVHELQFKNGEPRTLRIDLIFDTYDTPSIEKKDVREHTNRLFHLTTVHGDKHRPPVCRLKWGAHKIFFQGVMIQLEQQFTLFMEDGTPVRATSNCTFKEWYTNYDVLNEQKLESSDIAKCWILKRGETLSSIAAQEYRDPRLWRYIAEENNIADPMALKPGMELLIPVLRSGATSDRLEYD